MPPSRKRKQPELVDLTADDSPNPPKRPALKSKTNSTLNRDHREISQSKQFGDGYQSVYNGPLPTPPSSSLPQPGSHRSAVSDSAAGGPEILDLTQEDESPVRELYGTLHNKIVGIRFYRGYASMGEIVLCIREPNNQYDRNAIRVDNIMSEQVGHLPRKVVEKLAPYMDRGDVVVEAQLTGPKGDFDCPVRLDLYGPSNSSERDRIESALKSDKLLKATELKQTKQTAEAKRAIIKGLKSEGSTVGFASTDWDADLKEISLEELQQSSEATNFRPGGDALQTLALDAEKLSKLPLADQPDQLKSKLLPYQLQGLAWMTRKESPSFSKTGKDDVIQLWQRDAKGRFGNLVSGFSNATAPKLASGGILADDMGLGKTLQIISLILTGGSGTTLIVAPVSVMSNWEQQIKQHVKEEHMPKVFIYHSGNPDAKNMTITDLQKYDVVITSYGKLAREKDSGVPLILCNKKNQWRRVVLDEGHNIRNARTKVAAAACEMNAQSRWVLTGTPIVNSVKDLQSLVRFLHLTGGIEQPDVFNTTITRRLGSGSGMGDRLLTALLQDICLRRKKDMAFIDLRLPEKKEYVHRIAFRQEEKLKYDALLSEARGALAEYQERAAADGEKGRFQSVLERLLRLRQTCNHWTLCKARIDDVLRLLEDQDVVELTEKNRTLLQQALSLFMQSQEDCAVCYDIPTEPVITNCKHVFCRKCITKAIEIQHKCPMCRNQLEEENLLEPAVEGIDDDNFDHDTQSSKTEGMLQIIKATLQKPDSKIIVFSQWTSFLNIIQNQLKNQDIKYTRLDGSMNTTKRDAAITALTEDAGTRVLLASLAACSVGLNLVAADTVILSDSWWAPAIEDQAVDRVHRLGQTRETTIWRMVMEGSVEERVLDIQAEKRELVGKAFQEKDSKKQAKVTRVGDVQKLLA